MAPFLPDWQVLIRRADGRAHYFVVSRRLRAVLLLVFALTLTWAAGSTLIVFRQPPVLGRYRQKLDMQTAAFHAAVRRLNRTGKAVDAMTREVRTVHVRLAALAMSTATLPGSRGRPPAPHARPVPAVAGEIATMANGMRGRPGDHELDATRDRLHRLQHSIDGLQRAYAAVARKTAHIVKQHIAAEEGLIDRLGINAKRLVARARPAGRFIPSAEVQTASRNSAALARLLGRIEQWRRLVGAVKTLPLGDPLRARWRLSSPFGERLDPFNHRPAFHPGIDMAAPLGLRVYPTAPGRVIYAGWMEGYGRIVIVDNGNGFTTRYSHLFRILSHVGERVTPATVIGLLGTSGRSTGPHLLYEVRIDGIPHNPLKFMSIGRDMSRIG